MAGNNPNADFFAKLNAEREQTVAGIADMARSAATFWKTLVEEGIPKATATTLTWQLQRSALWRPTEPPPEDGKL